MWRVVYKVPLGHFPTLTQVRTWEIRTWARWQVATIYLWNFFSNVDALWTFRSNKESTTCSMRRHFQRTHLYFKDTLKNGCEFIITIKNIRESQFPHLKFPLCSCPSFLLLRVYLHSYLAFSIELGAFPLTATISSPTFSRCERSATDPTIIRWMRMANSSPSRSCMCSDCSLFRWNSLDSKLRYARPVWTKKPQLLLMN